MDYVIITAMIDRLEKKYGRYAIKNLIYYILGAYVIGYILALAKPEWYLYIILSPAMVMRGQVWRLFTWVCTAPQQISFLLIFMFLFYFYIGRTLEQYLGAFKYNLYIFSGWFFTTLGSMVVYWISSAVSGPAGAISMDASTYYINLTSFLAFAVIFPDAKVLLFAIIPIKMKILAWIDAGYLALQVISGLIVALAPTAAVSKALQLYTGLPASGSDVGYLRQAGIAQVITILISVLNFLIFFFLVARKNAGNQKRRQEFARKAEQGRAARSQTSGTAYTGGSGTGTSGYRTGPAGDISGAGAGEGRPRYRADGADAIVHRCSVCGRTNITNPELMFRYCSKCSGEHEYCQDHLFTHEHIK